MTQIGDTNIKEIKNTHCFFQGVIEDYVLASGNNCLGKTLFSTLLNSEPLVAV